MLVYNKRLLFNAPCEHKINTLNWF